MKEFSIFIENILKLIQLLPIRLVIIAFLWWIISRIEYKIYKKSIREEKTLKKDFQHACAKLIVFIVAFLVALFQFDFIKDSAGALLTSTSLLVALLGFCFQEAFSNAIHGVVLAMTEPFQIGNRISLEMNGRVITGIIRGMDMRCIRVEDIATSSSHLIPNRVMDSEIVQNFHINDGSLKSYQLAVTITYESDLEKAISIMKDVIGNLPEFVDKRTKEEINNGVDKVFAYVRDLNENGIVIAGKVTTKTIEENFIACSNARRLIIERFYNENIKFAYPRVEVVEHRQKNLENKKHILK